MSTPSEHPQDPDTHGQHSQTPGPQGPPPPPGTTPQGQSPQGQQQGGSAPQGQPQEGGQQGPPPPAQGQDPYSNPQRQFPPQSGVWDTKTPLTPAEERNLGMLSHLVPAILLPLSVGTLGFVGSLVIFLLYKDRGPFVRQHAANSLNVQIITAILLILSSLLMFVLIGFLFYPIVIIVAVIIHVVGAVKANNGEWWAPPLTPQFVR
ncbi:DUF4870 domain-containing protein [Janibacter cremeus]|uniref:DUF4870 domain-containing protein n=1 Tax=Janibacter cremeus TaxID=1285192 RepID=A0A852VPS8_9MICO|nr:DUF4870 domain-containing protein [Janibacter cremeus]NYF97738.1 hypothetical protein [Janibacter cremeus]